MKKQRVSVVDNVLTVEYPTIGKKFTADLMQYSSLIRDCAMVHGFKQKFGDAASGDTPAAKFEMVQRIHDSLLNGEWELTATVDRTPLILEAVARVKKIPLKKLQDAKFPEEKVKEWGSNAKVKAMILQIQAERSAKAAKESTDELEIEFDDEE
jgi:hypothetical protein